MTQLSFIAIIASVLVGLGCLLSQGLFWEKADQNTPKWKRILWKILRWFDLDEAPKRRKFLLKLLYSIVVLTALGCGFWDTYSAKSPEERGFFMGVQALVVSVLSFFLLVLISTWGITNFKENITKNYFKLNCKQPLITATNIAILCFWIAVLTFGIYSGSGHVFALISVSAAITGICSFILTFVGMFCWLIVTIIVYPLRAYIKWLLK